MAYNPEQTMVVVVDMQNGFCHPEGSLYAPPSQEVITPIKEFVEEARENGAEVAFTRDVHTEEQFEEEYTHYDEFDRWGEHVLEGSWEAEIVDELPVDDAHVVNKETYDAFHNTNFNDYLDEQGIETVIVVGTLANVCVMHTASSAALTDHEVIVVSDLVGYIEESDKEYALNHIDWLFGTVRNQDEIDFK